MGYVKFITTKGSSALVANPFYRGIPQHERTMSKREAYEYLAQETGFKPAAIRAAFMALEKYALTNAGKGNITLVDGVASIRNVCKGAFAGLTGPWVKGKNYLLVDAVELDPFKSVLTGVTPTNKTEGAKPTINTVYDDVTGVYDVITGTDDFSVAGSDLAPDAAKDDEFVAFLRADGSVAGTAEIAYSDLQNVKARLTAPIAAGEYTLAVHTRSGMGPEFGVRVATRKVVVG